MQILVSIVMVSTCVHVSVTDKDLSRMTRIFQRGLQVGRVKERDGGFQEH